MNTVTNVTQLIEFLERRARQIQRTLGTRAAAGFLRNRNVPIPIQENDQRW